MKFCLVLATLGRTDELKNFLDSLESQTHRNFDLIVVDQNPDDRLLPILSPYAQGFQIVHLRSEKGLSKARNIGLEHISGDIVAFPDDDCAYPSDLLEKVANFFSSHPARAGFTCRAVDENDRSGVGRWDSRAGPVNRFNVWKRGISVTIFLRRQYVERVGSFDETLGLGSGTLWNSSEEVDYLLRFLKAEGTVYYNPFLTVKRPEPIKDYKLQARTRAYPYGLGKGRVLRVHRYPLWFVLYQLSRPLTVACVALASGQMAMVRYYWAWFQGIARGWLTSSES